MKNQKRIIFGFILMIMLIFLIGPGPYSNSDTSQCHFENSSSSQEAQKSLSVELDSHSEDQINIFCENLVICSPVSRLSAILTDLLPDSYTLGVWLPPKIS
jgi:hypothetical protein